MDPRRLKPASVAAQALGWVDDKTRAIAPPIHTSTTFIRDPDNQYRSGRIYARDQNPTFDQAEAVLTALEGGRASLLFASGMAAATAVFQALAPGRPRGRAPGDVLVAAQLADGIRSALGARGRVARHERRPTRFAARSARARPGWCGSKRPPIRCGPSPTSRSSARSRMPPVRAVVVDSTVATPVLTQPLALGADIVMHAATKYLNGHSDVVAGTLTTRDESPLWLRIRAIRAQLGGIPGPFEAWLLTRGMRTLFPAYGWPAPARTRSPAFRAASAGRGSALSRSAVLPRACRRRPADARRFRRDAVDSRARGARRCPVSDTAVRRRPTSRFGSARRRSAAWRA